MAVPWMLEIATVLRLFDLLLMRFGFLECDILVPEVVAVLVTPFCLFLFIFVFFWYLGLGSHAGV